MKLHVILRIFIVLLFVACFVKRASFAPLADEVDYIKPIHKWVTDGPQREGVFHAPYFPWLESALGHLFGVKPAVLRSIGFVTQLCGAGLATAAALALDPLLAPWRLTMLLALVLLAPYALGSSLVLDHDPMLLLAATALYFFLLVRHERPRDDAQGRLVLTFGVALAICLMAKENTPLVYPLGLVVLLWRPFGFGRALLLSTLSALLGIAIFVALTALWCAHYAIPLADVFAMDVLGLRILGAHSTSGVSGLGASLWIKVMPVFWLGLPLTALFAAKLPALFRAGGAIRAIASVVVAVLFTYTFALKQTTYHFPKYMSPVLIWIPWLVLVVEREGRSHSNLRPENFRSWAIVIIALFVAAPIDPMRVLYERTAPALLPMLALLAVPTFLWALVRFLNLASWSHGSPRASTLALLLSIGLALSYARSALIAPGSITYWYGDVALQESRRVVLDWIARNQSSQVYLPSKDLAYANRETGRYLSKDELSRAAPALCAAHQPFLVVTRIREDSSLLHADVLEPLRRCMGPITQGVDIAYSWAYSEK